MLVTPDVVYCLSCSEGSVLSVRSGSLIRYDGVERGCYEGERRDKDGTTSRMIPTTPLSAVASLTMLLCVPPYAPVYNAVFGVVPIRQC